METPKQKTALVDKVIEKLSPQWALSRARSRRALAYEAAIAGRLRGYAVRTSVPNDYTEARDRIEIIRQARDLRDNFGLFSSILRKLSVYALGRVRYRARTGDKALNATVDAYIRHRSVGCDISGRYSLVELARMALAETLTAGDAFCGFRDWTDGTRPQLIEADRVGGDISLPVSIGEYGGVRYDPDTGRVLAYKVYDRTPAGAYTNPREVPAEAMAHIVDPERYDRLRGISPFAPVLNDMRDLKEVMAACLIGVKFNEYHAGFITGGSGGATDPGSFFSESATAKYADGTPMTETKLVPGTMQYLPEGYTANLVKSERPSAQFQSYLELLIRTIANALALPYGFVYSLSGLGGPGARMDAAQAQRVIEYWQTMIADRLLWPVTRRWILDGVASGDIPMTPGARLFEGDWQFPPRITIDVGRESKAGIEEIRAGLGTRADWWDEAGKDAAQQLEVIRDEAGAIIESAKQLSEQTGIPFERCLDMLDMRTPNGTAPLADTPPVPPAPPPDEDEPPAPAVTPGEPGEPLTPATSPEPDGESPELARLLYLRSAPHTGADPTHEDAIASALDAARRLDTRPDMSPEQWLEASSKIRYN